MSCHQATPNDLCAHKHKSITPPPNRRRPLVAGPVGPAPKQCGCRDSKDLRHAQGLIPAALNDTAGWWVSCQGCSSVAPRSRVYSHPVGSGDILIAIRHKLYCFSTMTMHQQSLCSIDSTDTSSERGSTGIWLCCLISWQRQTTVRDPAIYCTVMTQSPDLFQNLSFPHSIIMDPLCTFLIV